MSNNNEAICSGNLWRKAVVLGVGALSLGACSVSETRQLYFLADCPENTELDVELTSDHTAEVICLDGAGNATDAERFAFLGDNDSPAADLVFDVEYTLLSMDVADNRINFGTGTEIKSVEILPAIEE